MVVIEPNDNDLSYKLTKITASEHRHSMNTKCASDRRKFTGILLLEGMEQLFLVRVHLHNSEKVSASLSETSLSATG